MVLPVPPKTVSHPLLPFADCSHRSVPADPVTDKVVPVLPVHTVVPPETVPATGPGLTVTEAMVLVAVAEHTPLVTIAR